MIIAQIQDGRVHWVFEADEMPRWAPYIKLVDITALSPVPQEGWIANDDGTFTDPGIAPSNPCLVAPVGVQYSGVFKGKVIQVWLIFFPSSGIVQPTHTNPLDQHFFLV